MIEAIVFDMGGVFFHPSPGQCCEVLAQHLVTEDDLKSLEDLPELDAYKRGFLDEDTFVRATKPFLPQVEDPRKLFRALALARELNQDLVKLTAELKTHYRIAALSNSDSFLEERIDTFGIGHYFEFVINSYRVQMAKPDSRIFHYLIDKISLEPHQILFVDDLTSNIRVARQLGLHGHVFTTTEGLRRDMAAYGLLEV